MFGLEKWADGFDEIHRDNMRWYRKFAHKAVQNSYQHNGEGFNHYNTVVSLGVADALFDFVQIIGGGMIDNLRLGEGVKKGGFGYAEDTFRVLAFAGPILKVGRIAKTMLVPGGKNSCFFTSLMKGLRLGGRFNFTPLSSLAKSLNFRGFDTTRGFFGSGSDSAAGAKWWFNQEQINVLSDNLKLTDDVITNSNYGGSFVRLSSELHHFLNNLGIKSKIASPRNIEDVKKILQWGRGVMILDLKWKTGGRHFISAHRTPLGIRFADQSGTFIPPKNIENGIQSIDDAILIPDSFWLNSEFIPMAMKTILPNPFNNIGIPLVEVSPTILSQVEEHVRKTTKRGAEEKSKTNKQNLPSPPKITAAPMIKNKAGLRQKPVTEFINSDGATQIKIVYTYFIISGDTLFGLAKRFYGDAAAYSIIRNSNPTISETAPHTQLPIGQTIIIPGN